MSNFRLKQIIQYSNFILYRFHANALILSVKVIHPFMSSSYSLVIWRNLWTNSRWHFFFLCLTFFINTFIGRRTWNRRYGCLFQHLCNNRGNLLNIILLCQYYLALKISFYKNLAMTIWSIKHASKKANPSLWKPITSKEKILLFHFQQLILIAFLKLKEDILIPFLVYFL